MDEGIKYIDNDEDGVLVTGSGGADWLTNSGENVTIRPGKGKDTIEGSTYGDVFQFAYTSGNNVILNYDGRDTLQATSGTLTYTKTGGDVIVTIASDTKKSTITLTGAGEMFLKQTGNTLTADTVTMIENEANGVRVTGTGGADYIVNRGAGVTIQPGAGNDTIEASDALGEWFLIGATSGENLIMNFGANDTLRASSGTLSAVETVGNDALVTVTSGSAKSVVTLKGAAKHAFIKNGNYLHTDYVNTVDNDRDGAVLVGSNKRDLIRNNGANVTINGSAGTDTIEGNAEFGEVYAFGYADGENLILGADKNDSIVMTSGESLNASVNGEDLIVTMKKSKTSAKMTLAGAGTLAGDLKQTGNTLWFDYVNTVRNDASGTAINGSDRRDYILTNGDHVTINGSAGLDTLEGSTYGEVFVFGANTGDNVIVNFGIEDTLIGVRKLTKSGNNYIASVSGGLVTLPGTGGYKLVKRGATVTADYTTTLTGSANDTLLTGTDGRDLIINNGANVTIKPNGGDDTLTGSDIYGDLFVIGAGDGNNVITNFGTGDTISIVSGSIAGSATEGSDVKVTLSNGSYTGTLLLKDAANETLKSGKTYIMENGVRRKLNRADGVKITGSKYADWLENTGANVTINGGAGNDTLAGSDNGELYEIAASGGQDVILNFGVEDSLKLTSGSIQSTLALGDDLIINVKSTKYSGSVTLKDAAHYIFEQADNLLTVKNVNYKVNSEDGVKVTGTSKADFITNSGEKVTIAPGKGDDTIEGSNGGDVYQFAYNNGSNVILNYDMKDTLTATSGTLKYGKSGEDYVVTISSGTRKSTVKLLGTEKLILKQVGNTLTADNINYIDNGENGVKVTGSGGRDWVTNTGENVTLVGNKGNDTLEGSDEYGDVYQFAPTHGDDVIVNFGKNDTLVATSGTVTLKKSGKNNIVTISNGSTTGTVTLTGTSDYKFIQNGRKLTVDYATTLENDTDGQMFEGTSGRDLMINSGAKVTMRGGSGNDTLTGSMFAETYEFSAGDGSNVITNFGVGDTLKMTSAGQLTYKKSGDDVTVTLKGTGGSSKVTLQGAASLDLMKTENALYANIPYTLKENSKSKVRVTGTSGADWIRNYAADVTIASGAGSDTLEGSAEYGELFQFAYTSGSNVITNFGKGDTLRMTSGTLMTTQKSGSDYVVTITKSKTTSTITLSGAADIGTLQKSKDGKSLILRTTSTLTLSELPSEDYWFAQETALEADELKSLLPQDEGVELQFGKELSAMTMNAAELTIVEGVAGSKTNRRKA